MIPAHLKGRDFLRVSDWETDELLLVLDHAERLKARQRERVPHRLLEGRSLGMIFQKPSTRTRVSFEVGIAQLGGTGLYLAAGDLQLGRGETIKDTAVVLSRYLDGIMIRTFEQADVDELAEHADIPVINGLTDEFHPCQALADVLTIRERLGGFEGVRVAYLGDGNNVCHSLMVACAKLGMDFVAATPAGLRALRGGGRLGARGRRGERDRGRADGRRARGRDGGRRPLHRRLDEHGPGRGAGAAPRRPRRLSGSTPSWSRSRANGRSSSTASLPTTARRSRRTCSTASARRSGTRRRTACTPRRR